MARATSWSRDRLRLEPLELGLDRRLELIEADPGPRRGIDPEGGQIQGGAAIVGAGGGRELLLDHQRAIEPRGAGAAQDLREHLERIGVLARPRAEARRQIGAQPGRLLHARVAQHDLAPRVLRRLLDPGPLRHRPRRDRAVVLLGQRPQLRGIDVAGDDQHRIVGRIPGPVEGERILAAVGLHLMAPADHRQPVGVVVELGRVQLLAKAGAGIVVGPLRALLEDHAALAQHLVVVEHQIGHAVGFHAHDQLEAVLGDGLEVAGVVGAGERVLVAAVAGDDARELPGLQVLGPLEHEVLEEVGEPRLAERAVGRAHLVPDVVADHRRPPVGHHHHLHAVVESEGLGLEHGAFSRAADDQGEGQRHAGARGRELASSWAQNTSERKPWSTLLRRCTITGDSPSVSGLPSMRLARSRWVSAAGSIVVPRA